MNVKTPWLLFVLLPFCTISSVFATHITGAELIYECTNPATNTYQVTMTMYRDCENGQAQFDQTVSLFIFRGINNTLYTNASMFYNSNSVELIPIYWDACTGAPYNLCIEYAVYQTTVNLPPIAGGYNIAWARCCRNNGVTNIIQQRGVTVLARVPGNDQVSVCNNMPTFNDLPPVFLCDGQQFNFDHSAVDVDGDSLVYEISNPYHSINFQGLGATAMNPVVGGGNPLGPPPYQNVTYINPYSHTDPFGSGNFSIDAQSGLLTLTPAGVGISVFAVSVKEYRNGQFLSENKRDFQINVIACAPQGDEPDISTNLSPVPNSSGDTIYAEPEEPFCYNIEVADPENGDTVILFPVSAAFGIGNTLPPPFATLTFSGTNPAQGQVCWTPSCDYEGDTIPLIVGGRDTNDCPGYNIVFDTTWVIVRDVAPPIINHTLPPGSGIDSIFIEPGQSFCYSYGASDAEPSDVLTLTPVAGPFSGLGGPPPYATVSTTGVNPISGDVCWTVPCELEGQTILMVLEVTEDGPCFFADYDSVYVVIAPAPLIDAGPDEVICLNESVPLNASGGISYEWTPPGGLSNPNIQNPIASPNQTKVYTVNATDPNGCVWQDSLTVTVNALPVIAAGPDQIQCPSTPVQLNASGGITYSWSPTLGLSNPNIGNPTANPNDTITYVVTGTDINGCMNTDSIVVYPMRAIAGPDLEVCFGDTLTLTAYGGNTYSWNNPGTLTDPASDTTLAFPATSTEYVVTVSDTNGCVDTDTVFVTVNALPAVDAGPDQTICPETSAPFNATGASTYTWSPAGTLDNPNIANPNASPMVQTTYYVLGIDGNGCENIDSLTIDLFPYPVVTTSADTAKCGEIGVPILAGGGIMYQWSPALGLDDPSSANPIANPDSSTTYFVTVTDGNGCFDTDSVHVRAMYANAGPDAPVCIFDSLMLNASGGVAYQWDLDPVLINDTDANAIVFPQTDTEFYVTVTDSTGCTDRDTVVITVNPLPITSAQTTDPWICSGGLTTFIATGGAQYQWFPPAPFVDATEDTALVAPQWQTSSPAIDTSLKFYVLVTDSNGCKSLDSLEQIVRKLPLITTNADTFHCPGDSVQLSATGGVSFEWIPTANVDDPFSPTPTVHVDTSTTFQVTVTAVWGCSDSSEVFVYHINPNAGLDAIICDEDTLPLLATGGVIYSWNNGASLSDASIADPNAFPSVSTEYIVTVTDSVGCVDTDTMNVLVNPLPPADAGMDLEMCWGETSQLEATGGLFYEWLIIDSLSDPFIADPFANPTLTTEYIVEVTDNNGCRETDTILLVVHPLPVPNVGPDRTKCGEDSIQLHSEDGIIYSWDPPTALSDPNIASPMAEPDSNITYIVRVEDQFGCVNFDTLNIQTMYAQAGPDRIKCPEDEILLEAWTIGGQGDIYSWGPDPTDLSDPDNPTTMANPIVTTQYVVTITDTSGCIDTDTMNLIVHLPPPVDAGPDTAICKRDDIMLQGSGGIIYEWSPNFRLTDYQIANPVADPREDITYTLTVTDTNGCMASDDVHITVHPLPVVEAGPDLVICRNDSIELMVTGATTYQWQPEQFMDNPLSDTPIAFPDSTMEFWVLGTDDNGCQSRDSMWVSVWQLDQITGRDEYEICLGQDIVLSVEGAKGYEWSTGSSQPDITVAPAFTTTYWVIPYEENGCPGDTFFVNLFVERNLPRADFMPSPEEGFYPLQVSFQNLSTNATNYFWDFGDDSTSLEEHPVHTYMAPRLYRVSLTADNDIGCPTTYTYEFIDAWDFEIYFPTAFSPNNDGKNDEYLIVSNSIERFNIVIFDRWGQKVYESSDPNFRWDGTRRGWPVPEGVYTYAVEAFTYLGDKINRAGTITLIR